MLDDVERENCAGVDHKKEDIPKHSTRQKHSQWEKSLPNGNKNQKGSETPNRPDGNQQWNNRNEANNCSKGYQFGIILFNSLNSITVGQDECGMDDQANNHGVACHTDLEEKFIDFRVPKEMMEEVAVVDDSDC